jgi:hypothetical protein
MANISTEKIYRSGSEPICIGGSIELLVLRISRYNYLYGRVTENRRWKSIFAGDRGNKTVSENLLQKHIIGFKNNTKLFN